MTDLKIGNINYHYQSIVLNLFSDKMAYMSIMLGLLTILIALTSYSFYFRDIFKHKTKPHTFTWFIWSILNAFIFYEQLVHNGGPGAWVTGVAAVANVAIFVAAFKYGERNITRLDWLCLMIALGAFGIWLLKADTELAVILASSVFVVGFIPTIRKTLKKVHEETAITFALNSLKFIVALSALSTTTITTALYPIVLCITNGSFAVFLIWRQVSARKIKPTKRAKNKLYT